MSKKLLLFIFTIIFGVVCLLPQNAEAQHKIWHRPNAKGFFYAYKWSQAFGTLDLSTDMPYEIIQAYIIADSIVKATRNMNEIEHDIKNIGYYSDTLKYALKYIYLLSDYDPVKYFKFKNSNTIYSIPAGVYDNYIRGKIASSEDKRNPFMNSAYILHIKANNSTFVPDDDGAVCKSLSVFGCQVLDKIKGQILPDIDSYLFIHRNNSYISTTYDDGQGNNANICTLQTDSAIAFQNATINLFNNDSTDFIFEYCNESKRIANSYLTSNHLFDYPDGEPWIKQDKEYIVFLQMIGEGGDQGESLTSNSYYSIVPFGFSNSFGMFPIENGFVLDESNYFGFGTAIPLLQFKTKLMDCINQITNYGE